MLGRGRSLSRKEKDLKNLEKAQEKNLERRSSLPIKVELQVVDMKHAESEEVLQYCLKELEQGTTYNDLRLKLGLGPASIDRRWRAIREILIEMILPADEEEALRTDAGLSGYMIARVEEYIKKIQDRAEANRGEDTEAQFLKLELDSIKLLMEKYSKRTDHFLKMKDIQKKEKRTTGTTIIFNNLHQVRRPGENVLAEAAKLVSKVREIDEES
jgi:hypothetical protein